MQPKYGLNSNTHRVTPLRRNETISLTVDGQLIEVQYHRLNKHEAELTISGTVRHVYIAQNDNKLFLHLDGKAWQLDILNDFSEEHAGGASSGSVNAPMPGVVIEIHVALGQAVHQGDTLMLIESMKLQTEIKSTIAGTVKKIGVEPGSNFDKGVLLAEIETDEQESKSRE